MANFLINSKGVFSLLYRILAFKATVFLFEHEVKVDIFLSTEDFVDFKRNERRKIRMFPIDCKHYGLGLPTL